MTEGSIKDSELIGFMASSPSISTLLILFVIAAPALTWQYMTHGSVFITSWNVNTLVVTIQMLISILIFFIGFLLGVRVKEEETKDVS